MRICIESTDRLTHISMEAGGQSVDIPCRIWQGKTDSGIDVVCMIPRIAVSRDADCSQFDRELQEKHAPANADAVAAIPLRMIL